MIRRPPRSTLSSSSAASDVYKRQGPPELSKDWSDTGVEGAHRFLGRLWRMVHERYLPFVESAGEPEGPASRHRALRSLTHRTIMNVTRDIEKFAFNTAVSFIMELVNGIYHYESEGKPDIDVLS